MIIANNSSNLTYKISLKSLDNPEVAIEVELLPKDRKESKHIFKDYLGKKLPNYFKLTVKCGEFVHTRPFVEANTFIALQDACKFEDGYAEKQFGGYAIGTRSYLSNNSLTLDKEGDIFLPYYFVHFEPIPAETQLISSHLKNIMISLLKKSKIPLNNPKTTHQQLLCHFNNGDQLWGNGYIRESQIEEVLKEISNEA